MRNALRILFCLIPILSVGQTLPKTIHLDIDDGLIQNTVLAIEEDSFQRIWIGSPVGLQIYDGYELSLLPKIEGRIIRLQKKDSSIFCITTSAIFKIKPSDFTFTKVNFPQSYFYLSKFIPEGIALLDDKDSLQLFYNYDLQVQTDFHSEVKKSDYLFEFSLSNYTITGGIDGVFIKDSISLSNTFCNQFIKYNDKRVFVASHKGILEISINNDQLHVNKHFEDLRIAHLFLDRNENLWVGTADVGVFMIHRNSLQSDFFPKTHSDGSLISCWGFCSYNNVLYIATEYGVIPVEQTDWNNNKVYNSTKDLACNAIASGNDFLLIGTRSDGIYRLKNGRLENVFINPEHQLDNIIVQMEKNENGFLATSKYSLIQLDENGNFISQRMTDFDKQFAYSMSFYQYPGGIMSARTTGVIELDSSLNIIRKYKSDSVQVVSMMRPFQNEWWGVSMDAGLLKIENEELITIPFPDKLLFTLTNWKDNTLWISGIKGIYEYSNKNVRPYTVQNGFPIKEYNQNSLFKDSLGFLYYGGIEGVQKFHPDSLTFTPDYPTVLVERNEIRLTNKTQVKLDFDQSELVINVHPISITDGNLFKIEIGYNDKWKEINQQKQLSFTMPFGTSMIQIRITDLINKKSKTTQYTIYRDLPFWKKPWYIVLIFFVSVLLIIGLLSFIGFVKSKRLNKLAQIRIEEQQKGLSAVIQAQEDERKRIAKDLHDGIVQQLTGLKLGMQKAFSNNETAESNKLITILDNSAKELRELSHRMMPRSLREVGLIPALEDMLENSLGNTEIHFQFEYFGINQRFNENIEIAIYRIAQELVNNVIKHSKADKVNIQLFMAERDVILIIEDNGKGMDLSIQKEGIGLMNISSRLDTINGKVNFEPSPESGTLATVKIPIQ